MTDICSISKGSNSRCRKATVKHIINDILSYIKNMESLKKYDNDSYVSERNLYRSRRLFYFDKLTKYLLSNLDILYRDYKLIGKIGGLENFAKNIIKKYTEIISDITDFYNRNLLEKQQTEYLIDNAKKVINMNKKYLFSKTKYLFKTNLPGDIIREIVTEWI